MTTTNINRRIKPKNEVWYLWIKDEQVLRLPTRTTRERKILNAIRKMLIAFDYAEINLTNRERYTKHVRVSQEKLKKLKANDKWVERGYLQNE